MPDATSAVLRGAAAHTLHTARFDVDLRSGVAVPDHLVAEARAAAHAAGFAAGWAQGQREAQVETNALRERIAEEGRAATAGQVAAASRALGALGAAAANLESKVIPTAADLEDLLLNTAFSIAEAVLGRELTLAAEPGRDALARALSFAPAGRPVTVRLNHADHAALVADGEACLEVDGRTVTLVPDPTLSPGDALAECDATAVDARIASALERIREVLA